MRSTNALRWLFALAFLAVIAGPAVADRKPTAQERARIESVLRQQGFTRWGEIEFDDEEQVWGVDDAIGPDGREQDLRVDPNNMSVTEQKRD